MVRAGLALNDEARNNDEKSGQWLSSFEHSGPLRHSSFALRHFLSTSQCSTSASCHFERSRDISSHSQSKAARDSSTSLGMRGRQETPNFVIPSSFNVSPARTIRASSFRSASSVSLPSPPAVRLEFLSETVMASGTHRQIPHSIACADNSGKVRRARE